MTDLCFTNFLITPTPDQHKTVPSLRTTCKYGSIQKIKGKFYLHLCLKLQLHLKRTADLIVPGPHAGTVHVNHLGDLGRAGTCLALGRTAGCMDRPGVVSLPKEDDYTCCVWSLAPQHHIEADTLFSHFVQEDSDSIINHIL